MGDTFSLGTYAPPIMPDIELSFDSYPQYARYALPIMRFRREGVFQATVKQVFQGYEREVAVTPTLYPDLRLIVLRPV